jgi:hypothetical protein
MQPVRQQAHCVAASQAKKPADPDDDPARLDQSADLSGIHTMPNNLEFAFGIPGCLPAYFTMAEAKIFKRRRFRASCAELLDSNSKAM